MWISCLVEYGKITADNSSVSENLQAVSTEAVDYLSLDIYQSATRALVLPVN